MIGETGVATGVKGLPGKVYFRVQKGRIVLIGQIQDTLVFQGKKDKVNSLQSTGVKLQVLRAAFLLIFQIL